MDEWSIKSTLGSSVRLHGSFLGGMSNQSSLGSSVRLHGSLFGGLNNLTNSKLSCFSGKEKGHEADIQRVTDRLKQCHFVVASIKGDGNCQFASLSFQLFGTPFLHQMVRKMVCDQLEQKHEMYSPFVYCEGNVSNYQDYCNKMKKMKEWGDNITLQAAADKFQIKILVITSFIDQPLIELVPIDEGVVPKQIVILSYRSEVHYNAVRHVDEVIHKKGTLNLQLDFSLNHNGVN